MKAGSTDISLNNNDSLYNHFDEYNDIANVIIYNLLSEYEERNEPIQVNFRKMVNWIQYGERSSHMIHLYPAKLLPQIPVFFLSNDILSKKRDIVLDPFCGSGTVLLESTLSGRNTVGADSNPLARLISIVKTTPIDSCLLEDSFSYLKSLIYSHKPIVKKPDVINIDYWFFPHVISQLYHIKSCIELIKDPMLNNFFNVSFSNTLKKVSLADPRLSVPVKIKSEKYPKGSINHTNTAKYISSLNNINVYEQFYKITQSNIKRIKLFTASYPQGLSKTKIFEDARILSNIDGRIDDSSVQLILTSPPYAGAQKYIRASSLNLCWLGKCASNELRKYERLNIGREHYNKNEYSDFMATGVNDADKLLFDIFKINKLRSYIASKYLLEMREAISESCRVLKKGGYFVLVAASNKICGFEFKTHQYLSVIANEFGLKTKLRLIDDIHSRGLMTKRNKTAGIINCEWIYIFKKE